MSYADLHTHSIFSDGLSSPGELVARARALGLAAVALTDHDTTEGLDEFSKAGTETGIKTICGIEISAYFNDRPVHILGYGIDHSHPGLRHELLFMQQIRTERNERMKKRFASLGIPLLEEELFSIERGQVGRPHFARLLVAKKVVASEAEAFARFLKKNGAAYVAKEKYPASRAISALREAGGVAVLAHPWCSDNSFTRLPALINRMKDIGLQGIEAYYPGHPPAVKQRLIALAENLQILITGGSDYHGEEPRISQAEQAVHSYLLPDRLLPPLDRAMAESRQRSGRL